MENQMPSEGSKKKYLPIVVLAAVVMVGVSAYLLMGPINLNSQPVEGDNVEILPTSEPEATSTPVPSVSPDSTTSSEVKTFTVVGAPFSFSPAEIKVKKGDRVKIVFENSKGTHDWVIDEFNARTPVIQSGQTAEVEFIADKTGTFEYYCSVGTHRAMGMRGNLIVE